MTPRLAMSRWVGGFSGRTVGTGALIVALGLLAFNAGKQGLSNFFAQSAHLEIERWSSAGQKFRGDERARVTQYLAKSLQFSPNNPWSLEEMGTLQLRGMGALRDPQLAVAAVHSANANLRAALEIRPTSPFTWANFALTKLYLGEQDDMLFRALAHAEELGPWEPEDQQTVVFVGLAVWTRLNSDQQAAVVRAMERGAQGKESRESQGKMFEIAKKFNRIDLFCALDYSASQRREDCSSISKSGKKPNR